MLWGIFLVAATEGLLVGIALYARGRYSYELLQPYQNLPYLLVAGAFLIGIIRHDLFDVDRVIRKSATYFVTTGLVFAFFAVAEEMLSATLGSILPGEQGLLATAVSAVLAAALFEPVRRLIDRLLGAVAPSVGAPSR